MPDVHTTPLPCPPLDETPAGTSRTAEAEALRAVLEHCAGDLMDSPAGRTFLRWLLSACHCFDACDPGPATCTAQLHAREGRRVLGLHLLRLVQTARPRRVAQLLSPEELPHV